MTFYIKPPAVVATVKNLEDSVEERLTCYANIHCENIKEIIQSLHCLADDSTMDRIGHYLFRMVSHNNSRFRDVYLKNEVKILEIRLNCYEQSQVKFAVTKIRRHANEVLQTYRLEDKVKQFMLFLVQTCTKLLEEEWFLHAFIQHKEPCEQCDEFCFKVPFEFCLDLVASREYLIVKGFVHVYSFQWKNLLLSFFRTYLMMSLKVMKDLPIVRHCLKDERIKHVMDYTETLFSMKSSEIAGCKLGSFKLDSFGEEFKKFPPCMRNLYEILQKNNRLGHNDRFNFGKFLKGIGLSMEDALTFWEQAYSKEHTSGSKCTHNWKENEKRYTYSIRHLYGLEGSKLDYCIKSCQQIQDMTLSLNEEGGCPFKHFDVENLGKLLKWYLPPESGHRAEVIIHERQRTTPKKACELFMSEYLRGIHRKEVEENKLLYHDPADYYLLVKGLTSANL